MTITITFVIATATATPPPAPAPPPSPPSKSSSSSSSPSSSSSSSSSSFGTSPASSPPPSRSYSWLQSRDSWLHHLKYLFSQAPFNSWKVAGKSLQNHLKNLFCQLFTARLLVACHKNIPIPLQPSLLASTSQIFISPLTASHLLQLFPLHLLESLWRPEATWNSVPSLWPDGPTSIYAVQYWRMRGMAAKSHFERD